MEREKLLTVRLLADENIGSTVCRWLAEQGHDVLSINETAACGTKDQEILRRASTEARIIVTCDKDFGELVFRAGENHAGVVLLRLADERPQNQIRVLERLFSRLASRIAGHFVVLTEEHTRISRGPV